VGTTVAVAGASGYAGGELLRLLLGHPSLELGAVCAGTSAGERVTDLHPGLLPLADRRFAATDPALLAEAELVFLALPHGESAAVAAALPATTKVVDLGADFRLADPNAWATYYHGSHAGTWTYGLPELPGLRAAVAGSTRVANPGCYATAVAVALAPLIGRLAEPDDVVVVAASGTSGAGRKPSDALLASTVSGAVSAYKVGGVHQHTPEMEQSLSAVSGRPVRLSFTPLLAPMPRGILATCTARATGPATTTAAVRAALTEAYADEPFVELLPEGVWPTTKATYGSNAVVLQAAVDEHAGRVVVTAALDNLVKGAAGQAVQNANLVLGLPESAGLSVVGVTP
jgi:N-acetyl-gamma-glutamyl-phosphate reductase